jgi:hypothetical protein
MQKSTIALSFIVGVLVTVLSYQVYVNYQFQRLYNADHLTLGQVVQFLNDNIAKNNQEAGTTAPTK